MRIIRPLANPVMPHLLRTSVCSPGGGGKFRCFSLAFKTLSARKD